MRLGTLLVCTLFALLLAGDAVAQAGKEGAVFAMTNAPAGNQVVVFVRAADGTLTPAGSVATNGLGTGQVLGSQNGLLLGPDRQWLFAVNAGSDQLTVFRVDGPFLQLADTVASGGDKPLSVALHKDTLYVLHGGMPNNIMGFKLSPEGTLTPLQGSMRPLSAPKTNPGQIAFHPRGDLLVVTEKDTNLIDTFALDTDSGLPGSFATKPSVGQTPFAFAFRGFRQMVVTEAFADAPDAGALSTYKVTGNVPSVLTPSFRTTETATRSIVVTPDKKHAYVSNTGSDSVTGLRVGGKGPQLLDADGVTVVTGDAPTDLALSRQGRFLYVLNSLEGSLTSYAVDDRDGSLLVVQAHVAGLPAVGASGLAAH